MQIKWTKNIISLLLLAFIVSIPAPLTAEQQEMPWLTLDAPLQGAIESPRDVDWYRFNASAGSLYVIETYNLSLVMDTVLTLYYVDGKTVLAFDDDGGAEPLSSKIMYNFTEAGTYYVSVEHYDTELGTGSYTILLRKPRPPLLNLTVFDAFTGKAVSNATLRIYNVTDFKILSENRTDSEGLVAAKFDTRGYYLLVLAANGYHDVYGPLRVAWEGTFSVPVRMLPVLYTGSVNSSAFITGILAPSSNNTLRISLFNTNSTYSITLLNITVRFPWSGLYEGKWQGNLTITDGMPVTVAPRRAWNYSLTFTTPPDTRAYIDPTRWGSVEFHVKAQAWKLTAEVKEGVGIDVKQTLVTVYVDPSLQAEQGFATLIKGTAASPVSDPRTFAKLEELSSKVGGLDKRLESVQTLMEAMGSTLEDSKSRLKDIVSQLELSNKRLEDVRKSIDELSLGISTMGVRIGSLAAQMESTAVGLGKLSLQLSKLDEKVGIIDERFSKAIKEGNQLITTFYVSTQVALYVLAGILAILVVVNLFYLRRLLRRTVEQEGHIKAP